MSTSASPELENVDVTRFPTKVLKGHTETVLSVAYFGDGKRVVSGSWDKTIRIWDVQSGKQDGQNLEHDFEVWSISLSPDERTLAAGGDRTVVLWDLESRSVVWAKGEEQYGGHVAFSPDGQLIAAATNEGIVLFHADTRASERIRKRLQFGEDVWCLAFSPDGTQLAAGSTKGKVRVFDVATGERVVGPLDAYTEAVRSLVFTPDGKQFITASYDNSIRVWDSATGKEVGEPMLGNGIEQIVRSPDGRHLASAARDGRIRVWNVGTRQKVSELLQNDDTNLHSVAWSPNGRSVVAGDAKGHIPLWDVSAPLNDSDLISPPVLVAGSPLLPGTSRSRTSSLSPSILDLPAGASSPNPPNTNHPPRRDDFWDCSDLNLPARVRPSISPAAAANPPIPGNAAKESHPPASRFQPLARLWNKLSLLARWRRRKPRLGNPISSITRWTRRKPREDHGEPAQPSDNRNRNPPAQVVNSQPRPRHARRNDGIGMIAPAPGYDRYHSATEEYWYDPNNPPMIDRICFCMCFGVPKDDDNIPNADSDPETNAPTSNTQPQAGPSHSQNWPPASPANTSTSTSANAGTSPPRLGGLRRLWRRLSNLARRPARQQPRNDQHESHELQNVAHATPQPLCPTCQGTGHVAETHQ